MLATPSHNARRRATALWRIAWTVFTICAVQSLVCGLSVLPVLLIWSQLSARSIGWTSAIRSSASRSCRRIDIDVEIGADCQVGELSFVPKHTKLEAGAIYAGVPVRRIG